MIHPNAFYQLEGTEIVKCGECWAKDIAKSESGEYVEAERVAFSDLVLLSDNHPHQCDDCGKQNRVYEEGGVNHFMVENEESP